MHGSFDKGSRWPTQDKRLHYAARLRWGDRCPCCSTRMSDKKPIKGKPDRKDARTRGHVDPVARGGNPLHWVSICRRCNNEQGCRSFIQWARLLVHFDDPRAPLVVELCKFVEEWRKSA
jgi:hypothetical protein